jgi:hypothetical protein
MLDPPLLRRPPGPYDRGGRIPFPLANLTDDLNRLRENAVQLARSDAREVNSRFGQMGTRRLRRRLKRKALPGILRRRDARKHGGLFGMY